MENKTILISPFARALRNGKENAKNYPFANELVILLKQNGFKTIQLGISEERDIGADERIDNATMEELERLIKNSLTIISVDSFAQHLCWYIGKKCITLWGKSDPLIFGHDSNINLLKDRKNLRTDPFRWWEDVDCDASCFVSPEIVTKVIKEIIDEK